VSGDIRAAWEYLQIEAGEAVVLSAVYENTAGTPTLMAASLLVGPAAIASGGWPEWRLAAGFKPAPGEESLRVPASFVVELDGTIAGRTSLDQSAAYAWLRSVLEQGVCPAAGPLPDASASLGTARSPIRVCTHSETPAGDLATWLARPITGFHFPRTDTPCDVKAGKSWNVGDVELFVTGAIDLLGMSWFDEKKGDPPSGLLLGRFERRAWLASQRLIPEEDLYSVEIGLEPERVELADLEIEVEEATGEELVFAERLMLEETDIRETERQLYGPPPPHGDLGVAVRLPTLGRRMTRSVRLHHRDGMLLDQWQSSNIVESTSITLLVNGEAQPPITSGEKRGAQDMVELLGAVERVRSQYATMRREGTHNKIFEDDEEGREALKAILERAPGELLVVDAWFHDWELLANVTGPPPRVLIGKDVLKPPPTFQGKAAQSRSGLAPFHDRFYLWEGGGVSVGTSAGVTSNRLYRIVRMGAAEAQVLRDRFALWWADSGFTHL
jgi:hypothetical protein